MCPITPQAFSLPSKSHSVHHFPLYALLSVSVFELSIFDLCLVSKLRRRLHSFYGLNWSLLCDALTSLLVIIPRFCKLSYFGLWLKVEIDVLPFQKCHLMRYFFFFFLIVASTNSEEATGTLVLT